MVYGKGINDMPRGWKIESDWNYRVYQLWQGMIRRCYSLKLHEKHPSYKDCYVCERWLILSNFVKDITKIENYNHWLNNSNQRVALDKDIKVQGNKEYSLEKCMFVSQSENVKQAMSTRDYNDITGENHPRAKKYDRFDKQGNYIDTKYSFEYVQMGFNKNGINSCCKGRIKSHGGYIFRYHEED